MLDRHSQTRRLNDPKQLSFVEPEPRRIPLDFSLDDIRRLKSESHALRFSMRTSGYDPKEIPLLFNIDPGQWSNILSGKKHFPHDRRNEWMDFVGNEALLMYGCESRGYDFSTLRKHKSELQAQLEAAEKRAADAEYRLAVAVELMGRK